MNGRTQVETCCERVRQALVEIAGRLDLLDESGRDHVRECASCFDAAAGERALSGLLGQALPPSDEELEQRIMRALPARRARWRVVSLLPVAASLVVTLLGAALVGGVPGSGLLALLPAWSTQGWLALFGMAGDWGVVLATTARAAGTIMPLTAQLAAFTVSLTGLTIMLGMARRWRKSLLWPRAD